MKGESNLLKLIKKYKKEYYNMETANLVGYKNSFTYEYLIKRAIIGVTFEGERDSHSYRITRRVLKEMFSILLRKELILKSCKTFDEIFRVVYDSAVKGFGPLRVYDTSLAIAANFGIYPDKVYLHCGAFEGAIKLLGKTMFYKLCKYFDGNKNYPFLEVVQFPKELQYLESYHIENFLCHYRNEIYEVGNYNNV